MSDQPLTIPSERAGTRISPRRRWPRATFVTLALNVLVFLLMTLAGGSKNPDVLLDFGASFGSYFRRGEYWRAVMPMFLHIGVLHLLINSYALFVLGPFLERLYGYGRFALLYVGAGIGGSLLSMKLSNAVAAGASGAIFGIAGAMLVAGYRHREIIPHRWGRVFGGGILPFIIANLVFGFSVRGIDNWGHLGGLLSGALLALVIPPPRAEDTPWAVENEPLQVVVLLPVAVVALAMAATVDHYRASRAMTRLLAEGMRFRAANQPDRALERFKEAVRRSPRDERAHEHLGALYLQQKRTAEAVREYEEALRLNPDSLPTKLGLVLAYRQKGELAKAHKLLESVLGENPATPEGQQALADLCAEQKLYQEAIEHYLEALRLKPDMAEAHNNLAWLYATSEDPQFRNPKGALEHALRAVELSQWKVAAFVDTLAEALYVNGKYAEAVKVQTHALKLDPNNPELLEHMARYRKAAGV